MLHYPHLIPLFLHFKSIFVQMEKLFFLFVLVVMVNWCKRQISQVREKNPLGKWGKNQLTIATVPNWPKNHLRQDVFLNCSTKTKLSSPSENGKGLWFNCTTITITEKVTDTVYIQSNCNLYFIWNKRYILLPKSFHFEIFVSSKPNVKGAVTKL